MIARFRKGRRSPEVCKREPSEDGSPPGDRPINATNAQRCGAVAAMETSWRKKNFKGRISKTHAQNKTLRICKIYAVKVCHRRAGQSCGNSLGRLGHCYTLRTLPQLCLQSFRGSPYSVHTTAGFETCGTDPTPWTINRMTWESSVSTFIRTRSALSSKRTDLVISRVTVRNFRAGSQCMTE